MGPVLSVIVPIYKVEPYLRRCIDSICCQTLPEIEIILVDDGSPDNCGKICDEYAAHDPRIRVIHKENGGLSSARNAGIAIAQADIIGFVDSDDWIEPDMFSMLYQNLIKEDADIAVCGYYAHKCGQIQVKGNAEHFSQANGEAIQSIYQLSGSGLVVWNKLFRKHLFDDIRFPEGRIFEDVFVTVRLIDTAKKVVFDLQPKYHYMIRNDSLSKQFRLPGSYDLIDSYLDNYNYVCKKHPNLSGLVWKRLVNAHLRVLYSLFVSSDSTDVEKEKELISYLKGNRKSVWNSFGNAKKQKLFFIALCVSPSLCKLLVRIIKHTFNA